ncbi:MAG: hypothetical protein ACU0BF_02715 [Paracoccaceae bacterium]
MTDAPIATLASAHRGPSAGARTVLAKVGVGERRKTAAMVLSGLLAMGAVAVAAPATAQEAFVAQIDGVTLTLTPPPRIDTAGITADLRVRAAARVAETIARSEASVAEMAGGFALPNPGSRVVDLDQNGNRNRATVVQTGVNAARLRQRGDDNRLALSQVGSRNVAGIYQTGNGRRAAIAQRGTGNSALIVQN